MVDTSAIQWLLADDRTSERGLWRNKIPDRASSDNTENRMWNRPQQWRGSTQKDMKVENEN